MLGSFQIRDLCIICISTNDIWKEIDEPLVSGSAKSPGGSLTLGLEIDYIAAWCIYHRVDLRDAHDYILAARESKAKILCRLALTGLVIYPHRLLQWIMLLLENYSSQGLRQGIRIASLRFKALIQRISSSEIQ